MKEVFCVLTWQVTVPGCVVLPVLIIAVGSWQTDTLSAGQGLYSYSSPVPSRFWMTRNGCAFEAGEFSQGSSCSTCSVSLIVASEKDKAIKKAVTFALRVLDYQFTTGLWASSWIFGSECLVAVSCADGGCSCLLKKWRVSFETGLSEGFCQ